ncbi:hypothetical protein PROFUN_09547 [Planoprotostelium fungivorum]|uniref:Attractin/MKLN-like beta-propeller domain-containing protein n=1 Tax=Planoprotostelium fungivorum TaxID=1890364 RepID=A0A2P6MT36_9EUKA|nr:hypothetical protein PROFUN_09547 [Planoprotostelium fungivorum]
MGDNEWSASWSSLSGASGTISPPPPRGGHTCSFIEPHSVYVFGGSAYNKNARETSLSLVPDDLYVYNINTNAWTKPNTKGHSPSQRYAHSASVFGKKLVIFGGFNGTHYLDDVNVLDTTNMNWVSLNIKGKPPLARYAHSATASISTGKLFIFGGCGESSVFNELIVLDLVGMSWQGSIGVGGAVPSGRAYHTASIIGTKLYIFGGRAGNTYFNDLYTINMETLIWEKCVCTGSPSAPSPRAYHVACIVGKNIVIFGGMDGTRSFNDTWVLDTGESFIRSSGSENVPDILRWSKLAPSGSQPQPRHKHAAATINHSVTTTNNATTTGIYLWMFGGMDAPPNSYNDTFVLNVTCLEKHPEKSRVLAVQPATNGRDYGSPVNSQGETSHLREEISQLRNELQRSQTRVEFLLGRQLERASLNELEELERIYIEGLQRVSTQKKIINELQSEYNEKVTEVQSLRTQLSQLKGNTSNLNVSVEEDRLQTMQGQLTQLQTENLKLRRKLKDNPSEVMMDTTNKGGVAFGMVSVVEYQPQQGQGAQPSIGAAPLGMGMRPVNEMVESINTFERRRETERRGVVRVPEEARIQILRQQGVTDEALIEEARDVEQVRWNRMQSTASPTYNGIPENHREQMRKIAFS